MIHKNKELTMKKILYVTMLALGTAIFIAATIMKHFAINPSIVTGMFCAAIILVVIGMITACIPPSQNRKLTSSPLSPGTKIQVRRIKYPQFQPTLETIEEEEQVVKSRSLSRS